MRVDVIVNPVAGRHVGGDHAMRERRALIERVARDVGVDVSIHVTTHPGHATTLARAAASSGCAVVAAWGGDGTVNEVATGLAFSQTALAVVPAGSGNGLARELRLPSAPTRALRAAFANPARQMDLGELNGRLFVNVAGIGFDACVARAFNERRTSGWGLPKYVRLTLRELRRYEPQRYRVLLEGKHIDVCAHVIAVANSAQYGNGARIAPDARVDDGALDMVIIEAAPTWRLMISARRLFDGSMSRARGVQTQRFTEATISSDVPMPVHLDGEPLASVTEARVRIHPAALHVVADVAAVR